MTANRLEITMAETKSKETKPKEPTAAEKKAIADSQVPPTPETGQTVEVAKGDDAIAAGAAPVPVTTAVVPPEGTTPDEPEKKELPIAASNGSFYATLDTNANGIPTVSVLPVGWVGAAPLQISEGELKDLISVLNKLKR
jgi:hypothetical protein